MRLHPLNIVVALGLVVGMAAGARGADLKVGVISSLSGPVSALGIPYEKGIRAAQAAMPQLAGHKVQVFVLDDASDPTTAGRNARKLITEDKVDVLIGTSGDAFSAYTFDAWLLLADAAARTGGEPGTAAYRTALRDAIMSTKELAGTHGVYNFSPDKRYGSDQRAVVIVKSEKGQWRLAP